MSVTKVDKRLLMPVLAGFFIMGFCDIVAPISGRIAQEFPESHQRAISFLPTMVFLWFLLLSTPVAVVMNRIGRKATALAGYAFTVAGLLVSFSADEGEDLILYFIGFALLGVGNTVVQVAVNPLLATIVPSERMTSYLTIGQIFRNTALLLFAPIMTLLTALTGSWDTLLPIYAALTLAGGGWLFVCKVPEPKFPGRIVGFSECFGLLKQPVVLICTLGIAAFIAADVGVGFVSVRLIEGEMSILATTGFYACRILGTLVGAWVLVRYSDVRYLIGNMAVALALALALIFVRHEALIYGLLGMLGFTLSCVFATFYAVATKSVSHRSNEVAGLMILAISAGAISGPVCSALGRATGNVHMGLLLVVACVAYMLWAALKLNVKTKK